MSPRPLSDPDPIDDALPELDPDDEEDDSVSPTRKRRTRRRRANNPNLAEAGRKGIQLKQIRDELDQAFTLIGTAVSPIAPVTGATFVAKGPQGSSIVVNIAKKDERVFRALLAISKYAVWGELAMFAGTIAVAITVDMRLQSPDSLIVRRMIGDEVLSEALGERQHSDGQNPQPPQRRPAAVPSGWTPAS